MRSIVILCCVRALLSRSLYRSPPADWDQQNVYFEGDILSTNHRVEDALSGQNLADNAIRSEFYRWPDGVIPYEISQEFSVPEKEEIERAMGVYHSESCLRLIPRSSQPDYVEIRPGLGCASSVGRQGGKQELVLGSGCVFQRLILHELAHLVGLFHEQSRPDRDQYVKIFWANVKPEMEHNFQKYDIGMVDELGAPYDYESILHYRPTAFSRSGAPTVLPLVSGKYVGLTSRLSPIDLFKINKLYHCPQTPFWARVARIPAS